MVPHGISLSKVGKDYVLTVSDSSVMFKVNSLIAFFFVCLFTIFAMQTTYINQQV